MGVPATYESGPPSTFVILTLNRYACEHLQLICLGADWNILLQQLNLSRKLLKRGAKRLGLQDNEPKTEQPD